MMAVNDGSRGEAAVPTLSMALELSSQSGRLAFNDGVERLLQTTRVGDLRG